MTATRVMERVQIVDTGVGQKSATVGHHTTLKDIVETHRADTRDGFGDITVASSVDSDFRCCLLAKLRIFALT
jgi:hypothetical protein